MKILVLSKLAGPMIRHGATVLGGWLLANGYADESTAQQIVGGASAAAGVVLSLAEKRLR